MASDLPTRIAELDDDEAVRLLTLLAKVVGDPTSTRLTADRREALQATFGTGAAEPVEPGDLAKAALHLHARDPSNRNTLADLMQGSAPDRFVNGLSVDVPTAVLVLLRPHIHVERDENGDWASAVAEESAPGNVLGTVVRKLLAYGSA